MRFVIRADAHPEIGGGHLMRCLTLAGEAAGRGHDVTFVVNAGEMAQRVRAAGHDLIELPPVPHEAEPTPPHADWLTLPWAEDAARTAQVVAERGADWLIWDHYGLDARWVDVVRKARPGLRVLALDDLDDRPLGSDLVLDPAWRGGERRHPVPGLLYGPDFALLRPEFAAARTRALARRDGRVRRVLIAPGLMDAAGLAPLALDAVREMDLTGEVVMGAASQSVEAVRDRLSEMPGWSLTLDATDMAARMVAADLCIGAGGGTSWERCCLGLPTVAVAVAANQDTGIAGLARAGAVVPLTLDEARASGLGPAIEEAMVRAVEMSQAAASLCDGRGAARALDALEARLRPIAKDDAQRLFDWRNQPHIRAASHTQAPLVWSDHIDWLDSTLQRTDGRWCIYEEGRPLGFVGAVDAGAGLWRWSFYIGEAGAPRGAGGRMLARFLADVIPETGAGVIEGEVLAANAGSAALHRRLGFEEIASDKPGVLVFRREL